MLIENSYMIILYDYKFLLLSRWPAITWTSVDPIHWLIYVVLGGEELTYILVI